MKSGDPEHEKHNTSHGKEMIMKELRIAIIGCGMISHRHMTVIENLKALCVFTLEPLREALGMPIIITSGYRSKALNDRITHHSSTSQHMNGEAADFYVGWNSPKEKAPLRRELLIKAFRQIITDDSIVFDQCIIYPSFIHVSYVRNGKNRSKLIRGFGNGKYAALTRTQALSLV